MTVEFRQETHNETAGVKQDYNRLGNQVCTVRLSVRTLPFHGSKRSSILLSCTNFRSVRIEVITVDCLSTYGGSIPPQTASLFLGSTVGSCAALLMPMSEVRAFPGEPIMYL